MRLYIDVKTNIPDLCLDHLTIRLNTGKEVRLDWESSEVMNSKDGFYAIYRGIALDEVYAKGHLNELENLRVLNVGMYSQAHAGQPCEFMLRELHFVENNGELEFKGNLYSLEDKPWFRLENFNQLIANDEDYEFMDPDTDVVFTVQSRWLQDYFGVDNAIQLEAVLEFSNEADPREILSDARKEPVYSNLHVHGYLPPSYEEAEAWLQRNGHPYPASCFVEIFINGAAKERQSQHWEAVANDYCLPDFDRWQHFQDILGTTCSWSCFCTCANALHEEDIDVMDIDIDKGGERAQPALNEQIDAARQVNSGKEFSASRTVPEHTI